jgi:aspartyl-tRNA(Asn)/glutamyl-tRNA(Gln) amidotransferase subunit A
LTQDIARLSAAEMARLVRTRALSPVEIVKSSLERIEATQSTINAFITVCHEQAMADARAAEAAVMRKDELGPLHGVPYSAKDMIMTAGVRTTLGSRVLEHHVPDRDGVPITRMRKAGAILVGKTTTPEFAHSCLTAAPLYGHTRNVWDHSRTPGGSSGGAAASVAAGLVPLALGTDSGGSTRIPAACNGIVGLKQTQGLVPDDSTRDAFATLVFVNPIARDVQDTAMLLDALTGPDPSDPYSLLASKTWTLPAAAPQGDLRGMRIGWLPSVAGERVDAEVLKACEEALRTLASLGAEVSQMPEGPIPYQRSWAIIQNGYRVSRYGPYVESQREKIGDSFLQLMGLSKAYTSKDLTDAMFTRATLFRQVQHWFESYDVVITPTLTRTAIALDHDVHKAPIMVEGHAQGLPPDGWFPSLGLYNMTGHPAISVPCGWASDGLPVAFQAAAPWGQDARLVRLTALFEQARPELDHGLPPM